MMKSPFVQAIVLIAAGFALAVVSNAVASRDRRLVLPGYYPGARTVPATAPVLTPAAPERVRAEARTYTETTTIARVPTAPILIAKAPDTSDRRPATASTTATAPTTHDQRPTTAVPTPKPTKKDFAPHPDKAYVEVSGDDAAQLHADGALTLDARRTSVYEQGHISGARSFSVWESDVDEKVNKLYEERSDPREQFKPILIYCSGGDCEDSHMLAQKLWGVQFNNIYVYKDGFPDWQKRGGSIHTGSNP